jgi:hypothetical protein
VTTYLIAEFTNAPNGDASSLKVKFLANGSELTTDSPTKKVVRALVSADAASGTQTVKLHIEDARFRTIDQDVTVKWNQGTVPTASYADPKSPDVRDLRPAKATSDLQQVTVPVTLSPAKGVTDAHYRVQVTFIGNDAVQKDTANYNCTFDLEESDVNDVLGAPKLLGGRNPDFNNTGGNLSHDTVVDRDANLRLLIRDHHGIKRAETGLDGGRGFLTSSAPSSRLDNYKKNGWLKHVQPLVGFRVSVWKVPKGKKNSVALDDGEVTAIWTVRDPGESPMSGEPKRAQDAVSALVRRFKRVPDQDPPADAGPAGDDNCPTDFGGLRPSNDVVDATSVLFDVALDEPTKPSWWRKWSAPQALSRGQDPKPPAGKGAAAAPSSDSAFAGKRAQSTVVVNVDPIYADKENPFGFSDVFFSPLPIGGDDYALDLVLVDKNGTTVAMTDVNDAPLVDGNNVPAPYTIGPIVIWRKVPIDVVASCGPDQSVLDWEKVRAAFRRGYVEIDGPFIKGNVAESTWKAAVKKALQAQLAGWDPADGPTPNIDLSGNWGGNFLPPIPANWDTFQIARTAAIDLLDTWVAPNLAPFGSPNALSPLTDAAHVGQDDTHGFMILLCPQAGPPGDARERGGLYYGDRQLIVFNSVDPKMGITSPTLSVAHELGHSQYLRHSFTDFKGQLADGSRMAYPYARVDVKHSMQSTILDHDQADSITCTMAYCQNADGWHFCGGCLLKLRGWDLLKLQKTSVWQKVMFSPAAKAWPGVYDLQKGPTPLSAMSIYRGETTLLTYAPAEPATNALGGPYIKWLLDFKDGLPGGSLNIKPSDPMLLSPFGAVVPALAKVVVNPQIASARAPSKLQGTIQFDWNSSPDPSAFKAQVAIQVRTGPQGNDRGQDFDVTPIPPDQTQMDPPPAL